MNMNQVYTSITWRVHSHRCVYTVDDMNMILTNWSTVYQRGDSDLTSWFRVFVVTGVGVARHWLWTRNNLVERFLSDRLCKSKTGFSRPCGACNKNCLHWVTYITVLVAITWLSRRGSFPVFFLVGVSTFDRQCWRIASNRPPPPATNAHLYTDVVNWLVMLLYYIGS